MLNWAATGIFLCRDIEPGGAPSSPGTIPPPLAAPTRGRSLVARGVAAPGRYLPTNYLAA